MNVESRYLLGKLLCHHKHGHLWRPLHNILQAAEPALREQKRPWPKAGANGAADDFLPLSDKEPALRLEVPTK
jgi:hypothetical protein